MSVIEAPQYNPAEQMTFSMAAPEKRQDIAAVHLLKSEAQIDTNAASLYDPTEIGMAQTTTYNEQVSVIGDFAIPAVEGVSLEAAILKLTSPSGVSRFVIGGLEHNEQTGTKTLNGKWLALNAQSEVTIGRIVDDTDANSNVVGANSLWHGTKFGERTSRKHLQIKLTNNTILLKDTSINGTDVRGDIAKSVTQKEGSEYASTHTLAAKEFASYKGMLSQRSAENSQEQLFAGRPIIDRNMFPIDGAVDIRSWVGGGEAIVVDSKLGDSAEYKKLLDDCINRIVELQKTNAGEKAVLNAIFDSVNNALKYDLDHVNKVSDEIASLNNGHNKVSLGKYLQDGKGVCRHMALTAVWLGGEMYKAGLIKGKLTAEVNQNVQNNSAHEWARYTAPDGTVTIIDPAQMDKPATLQEILADTNKGIARWEYFRDGEKLQYEARLLGGLAVQKAVGGSKELRWWKRRKVGQ